MSNPLQTATHSLAGKLIFRLEFRLHTLLVSVFKSCDQSAAKRAPKNRCRIFEKKSGKILHKVSCEIFITNVSEAYKCLYTTKFHADLLYSSVRGVQREQSVPVHSSDPFDKLHRNTHSFSTKL